MRKLLLISLPVLMAVAGCAAEKPAINGTSITPEGAFKMWDAERNTTGNVNLLDVRTPGEFIFVGHAIGARNIPVKFLLNQWNEKDKKPAMKLNPNFVEEAKKHYQPEETILVMCKTGERGAVAVDLLRKAGYTNAYNIEGGFEGDRGKGCDDHGLGQLVKPGWRNSGLKWTMTMDPEVMYIKDKE